MESRLFEFDLLTGLEPGRIPGGETPPSTAGETPAATDAEVHGKVGLETRGPNPEHLFAGAYSACFHGALNNAATKYGVSVDGSRVEALVSLIEDDEGGYRLAVELRGHLPGVDRAEVQRIMDEAHRTCPYSKALRGDTCVKLVVE